MPARERSLRYPLTVWAAWRVAQAVVLLVAGGDLGDDALRFDAGWYLSILSGGYELSAPSFASQQNVAFFPGLVWLTEPFSWVLGDRSAAVLVANVTGLTAFLAVFAAVRAVVGEVEARRTVVALAVWPTSIVLTAFYSEGLFLTATAGAVWAAARGRDAVAVVAGVVAALTRSIGFLLGPVLAVDRLVRRRRLDVATVTLALSGPAGLGAVAMVQQAQVDDPLAFAKAQEGWDRSLAGPWEPVVRAGRGIVDELPRLALDFGLNLAAIVLVGGALAVVTLRLRGRSAPWGLAGWGWVAWLAPLFTTVPSSQVRFVMAAWPAGAALGHDRSRRTRLALAGAALLSIAVSLVVIRRWATGEFSA